jgi:hypothetical protein
MTAWYAIRTAPGAQKPQREFKVETTMVRRDKEGRQTNKGYRIVPSLDPNVSAIERALKDNGFRFYMPCEFEAVRDRRKTNVWTTRRFPILQGYVFVADVHDFGLLESLPGVVGTVGSDTGTKYELSITDFMFLRTKEAASLASAETFIEREKLSAESRRRAANAKKLKNIVKRYPKGTRVSVQWGKAVGREATIVGYDDEARLRAIADGLESAGVITLSTEDVKMVA